MADASRTARLAGGRVHASESTRPGTHDWDVKHLVRTIVTSHTYRQSSMPRPDGWTSAIPTTGCWRGRAASASTPRSCATSRLHVSGLLAEQFGGPSVKPYQPDGYLAALNFPEARVLGEPRRRPVPPRPVHALAAHVSASEPADLRCADARRVHRQPRHVEHAAAGAGAAERSDLRRGRARLRAEHRSRTAARRRGAASTGRSMRALSRPPDGGGARDADRPATEAA